jgi:hypothetical protein|tara:strand:+ start:1787 stop:2035 length:249 start_codon:yes stop_codon:yes gene_type:complete
MNKQFLSPEELIEIKSFNDRRNELTKLFGSLEFDLQLIKIEKSKVIEELKTITESTSNMAIKLQEKYGEGNVNIKTGEVVKL